MNAQMVLTIGRDALVLLLTVSLPILLVVLVVGPGVSIFQANTQIHEATLAFVPKLIAAALVFALAGPWMLSTLGRLHPPHHRIDSADGAVGRTGPGPMLTFSEAQLMGWCRPSCGPSCACWGCSPRRRCSRCAPSRCGRASALAFLIALCVQATLDNQPVIGMDSAQALGTLVQQVGIGMAIGIAVRLVFASVELAGELVGLQMGLNFAAFFNPMTSAQSSAVSTFFATSRCCCSSSSTATSRC